MAWDNQILDGLQVDKPKQILIATLIFTVRLLPTSGLLFLEIGLF